MENRYFDHGGQRMTLSELSIKYYGPLTTDYGRHGRSDRGTDDAHVTNRLTKNNDRTLVGVSL